MSTFTRRIKRKSAVFIAPSFLGVLSFFLAPMLVVFYYSVVNNPIQKEFVFLDNYKAVISNSAFKHAVINTAKFSVISVPLVVVLSLMVALALEKSVAGKTHIRSCLLSPMMVPIASVILIWQVLFHYSGVVNEIAARYGADPVEWLESDKAFVVIILLFVWKNLGYNMILFMAALSNLPSGLVEVARLDCDSEFKIFWTIRLRYLASTILFVTILSLISSFKVFREIYLLTGDYPYALYMLQHYMNNMFGNLDYQKLSAAAIMMSITMIILVGLLFVVENFVGKDLEE